MSTFVRSFRWRWASAALVVIATLAGCMSLDTQQRKWIFQATAVPGVVDSSIDGLDDVWIEYAAKDGVKRAADSDEAKVKLHALWRAGPTPKSPVMLYLHGARRNVDSSAFRIRHMQEL